MKRYISLISILCIVFLYSCDDDSNFLEEALQASTLFYSAEEIETLNENLNLPTTPYNYGGSFSTSRVGHIPTLGRVLFYDTKLSVDGTISCASCHHQELAFSDNKAVSDGPNGRLTKRNSIALGTFESFASHYGGLPTSAPKFFWDERASSIREQLEQTIMNPDEMGMDLDELEVVLNDEPHYQVLFNKAFGSAEITSDNVISALASFVNSLSTKNSKFDEGHRQDMEIDFFNYTEQENLGKRIFNKNCNSCHGSALTAERGFPLTAQNGIAIDENDLGVAIHTGRAVDRGVFKVPSLRNIALTAPYMHDGRFATLEDVVEHYNSGIEDHPNLHEFLKEGDAAINMNLADTEKEALIAFLNTLTDDSIVEDVRWSDPFK